jgi:hypothetical protein
MLRGGNLKAFEARDYFANVSIIDVRDNQISSIKPQALQMLHRASRINLGGNKLTTLPEGVQKIDKPNGVVSLYHNPWDCSCRNEWMQDWMAKLDRPTNVVECASPSWLDNHNLLESDFCSDPERQQRILIGASSGSVAGGLLLLVASVYLVFYGRVWIFTRFNIRVFYEWDDCIDGRYDAFVSFAWDDYTKVLQVVEKLEDQHGFRCCIHNRDFNPGGPFRDMMARGIKESRRTLCFLSPNFLQSEYCIWEFRYAFESDVDRGKKRLAAILLDPISDFDESNRIVKQYVNTHTYLDVSDENFDAKMLYVMPQQPVGRLDEVLLVNSFGSESWNAGEGNQDGESHETTPLLL